jgi:hypothetical protein
MDIMWAFRQAYKKAQEIKSAQDSYCEKALQGQWAELERSGFPEDLQWEGLVDVLRHRVKVNYHLRLSSGGPWLNSHPCRFMCIAMKQWTWTR